MSQMIGFDRRIKQIWLDAAASHALGSHGDGTARAYLDDFLQAEIPALAARRKTLTVLLRIWASPPSALESLRDRGLCLFAEADAPQRLALHWGMTVAVYPFFRDVADVVGRLLRLHGEATLAQITRRICERYGDRERTRRSARHAVQTIREWNLLLGERGTYRSIDERRPIPKAVSLWLLEAVIASQGRFNGAVSEIGALPCLYPFALDVGLRDIRKCEYLEVHIADAQEADISVR